MSSETLQGQIECILNREVVNRHSYFQLKYFVVGKEYTRQSKMWCCIRELQARQQSIVAMQSKLEDLADDIELMNIEMERIRSIELDGNELNIRERALHLRKRERQKSALEQSILDVKNKLRDAQEEANFFAQAFQAISAEEELKPYDDLDSQAAYWNEKLTQEIYLRTLLNKPLELELIKTVLSIKDDLPIKKEILDMLEAQQKLMVTAAQKRMPKKLQIHNELLEEHGR